MQIDEYPVNVPTSTAKRASTSRVSSVMNAPCSGAICIRLAAERRGGAISDSCTASGGVPCVTAYS